MEDWDEAKLEDVVNKKHGEQEKSKQQTAIVRLLYCHNCKFGCLSVINLLSNRMSNLFTFVGKMS